MGGHIRLSTSATVISALVSAICGCEPGPAYSPARPRGYIAVVGAGRNDALWPVLRATAARFERTTASYHIRAVTPDAASPAGQAETIAQLPRDGLRGLCVHVFDPLTKNVYLSAVPEALPELVCGTKSHDELLSLHLNCSMGFRCVNID